MATARDDLKNLSVFSCIDCRFFEARTPEDDEHGTCRRHAPKPGIWAGPGGRSAYYNTEQEEEWPNVLWPKVTPDDWCADGRSKRKQRETDDRAD